MSFYGIKKKMGMFLINKVFIGTKHFKIKRNIMNGIGFHVGKNTKIVGPISVFTKLEIGNDCWIGRNFSCEGNGEVIIGNNCDIAPNVTFLTGGHKIGDSNRRAGVGEIYKIKIGNGCWICANSTIGKNVTIGNSSIVAACACVLKNVDDNVIVGGVPARLIRSLKNEDNKKSKKK